MIHQVLSASGWLAKGVRAMRRVVPVAAALVLLAGTVPFTAADARVDPLRGRWDLTLQLPEETSEVRLFVDQIADDPADPYGTLATGCLEVVESGQTAPASLRAIETTAGQRDVTVFSSVDVGFGPSVLRLDGVIALNGRGVSDDTAGGSYVAGFGEGEWFGDHHDRRNPKCTNLDLGSFAFEADALTAQDAEDPPNGETLLASGTQIVSSGMLVESPTLGTVFAEPFTDIFSPEVDFIEEFRFIGFVEGVLPPAGESFTFTLLDLLGNPIPGAVATDTWNGCFQGAPGNLRASYMFEDHLEVTWDAVAAAPGFDPANGVGFYQIESDGGYGANLIGETTHQIPWDPFGESAPGVPDGNDFGAGLSESGNGTFEISTISFAEDVGPGGSGLACQVRDEPLLIEITGSDISVLS